MADTTERPLADALTAIKTRRSVKEYLPTEVPREWIEELLDAAHWAPNHKLTHPWRFHVFTGTGRERLVAARQAAVRAAAEKKGRAGERRRAPIRPGEVFFVPGRDHRFHGGR